MIIWHDFYIILFFFYNFDAKNNAKIFWSKKRCKNLRQKNDAKIFEIEKDAKMKQKLKIQIKCKIEAKNDAEMNKWRKIWIKIHKLPQTSSIKLQAPLQTQSLLTFFLLPKKLQFTWLLIHIKLFNHIKKLLSCKYKYRNLNLSLNVSQTWAKEEKT